MVAEDRGTELLAVIWPFTALAIIVVTLKLFSRAHILHSVGWDDGLILFSLLLVITCTCIFTYDVKVLHFGRHAWDIDPAMLPETLRINQVGHPFGIMAYSFPNIAIAIVLHRLLVPNSLRSYALFTLTILQVIIAAISCVLLFTQCTPTEFLWNPMKYILGNLPYSCLPEGLVSRYSYFVGAYTALVDIVLAVVPIRAMWNLKLATRTKVGLFFLMGCSLFAAICSIVKTVHLDSLAELDDFTHATVDLTIWAIVEACVIIMAASIPSLRPFFKSVANKNNPNAQPVSEGKSFFRGGKGGFFHSLRYFGSTKSLRGSDSRDGVDNSGFERMSADSRERRDLELQQQQQNGYRNPPTIGSDRIYKKTDITMVSTTSQV